MKNTLLIFQPSQALSTKAVETPDLQGNPKYAKVISEKNRHYVSCTCQISKVKLQLFSK